MQKGWSVTKGFSLVEVVLATALFAIFVTAFAGVYLYGQESTALAGNRARATLLAEEGLEVVKNLKDESFLGLTAGTHGLAIASGVWGLSGASDTTGIFTRQIIVTDVDTKRKNVVSKVTWQQNSQRSGSVTLSTRFTNWAEAVGLPTCVDQATKLTVDTSGAILGLGNKLLDNILVQNSDTTCAIVIDKVTVTWTDISKNIERVRIKNGTVWNGSAATGTLLDIDNTTLSNSDGFVTSDYLFSGSMSGNTFTITFTMGDATTKVVSGITP